MPNAVLVRNGSLTDRGHEVVRELAVKGHTTEEICAQIPDAPRQSVIAHVAVAHRKPKPRAVNPTPQGVRNPSPEPNPSSNAVPNPSPERKVATGVASEASDRTPWPGLGNDRGAASSDGRSLPPTNVERLRNAHTDTETPAATPAKPPIDSGLYVSSGELTQLGHTMVRRLAVAGFTTDEICSLIPAAPRQSVIAHLAISRRAPKK